MYKHLFIKIKQIFYNNFYDVYVIVNIHIIGTSSSVWPKQV